MLSIHVVGASGEIEDVGSRVEHRAFKETRTAAPVAHPALSEGVVESVPCLAVALPKHNVAGVVLSTTSRIEGLSLEDLAGGDASWRNHVFLRLAVPRPSKLKHAKRTSGLTTGFDQEVSVVALQDDHDVTGSSVSSVAPASTQSQGPAIGFGVLEVVY